MFRYDFILKNGRVIDAAHDMDKICDLGIKDGQIAAVGRELDTTLARQVIDVSGKLVIPGIVDSHCHVARPHARGAGYRMLVKAGVTTAVDFEGPLRVIMNEIQAYGCGVNIGVLEAIYPGNGIKSNHPRRPTIEAWVNKAMDLGALGVKLLGGHYPLSPESTADIMEVTVDNEGYTAFHVGSTKTGSDIRGLEEALMLAGNRPLHIAHVNAYCRGLVENPFLEIRKALDLLKNAKNIVSESHLAPYNGCSSRINQEGLPKSHVTRNCLRLGGYEISAAGLGQALKDGYAGVYARVGGEQRYLFGEAAFERWKYGKGQVGACFPVNLRSAALAFASEKNAKGDFIVEAISSDGGAVPRNFILSHGLALVDFGVLSIKEFVAKSSLLPARMFGFTKKGHFSVGADADIAVVDAGQAKAEIVLIGGKLSMASGIIIDRPGKVLTTGRGVASMKSCGVPHEVVDLKKSLFYKKVMKKDSRRNVSE